MCTNIHSAGVLPSALRTACPLWPAPHQQLDDVGVAAAQALVGELAPHGGGAELWPPRDELYGHLQPIALVLAQQHEAAGAAALKVNKRLQVGLLTPHVHSTCLTECQSDAWPTMDVFAACQAA